MPCTRGCQQNSVLRTLLIPPDARVVPAVDAAAVRAGAEVDTANWCTRAYASQLRLSALIFDVVLRYSLPALPLHVTRSFVFAVSVTFLCLLPQLRTVGDIPPLLWRVVVAMRRQACRDRRSSHRWRVVAFGAACLLGHGCQPYWCSRAAGHQSKGRRCEREQAGHATHRWFAFGSHGNGDGAAGARGSARPAPPQARA